MAPTNSCNGDLLKGLIPVPFGKFWDICSSTTNSVKMVNDVLSPMNHRELKLNAEVLEKLASCSAKDWRADRPGLLELVDPFLHCFVSGVTSYGGVPEANFEIPCEKSEFGDVDYSNRFQLLPTEFSVGSVSKKVNITSYINNLDPREHQELYGSIELLLEKTLPYFENVLDDLLKTQEKWSRKVDLSGRTLQVIVGIKNIHLTPGDNPAYDGSTWHIEVLKNERIVASAIYYYDVHNISESQLEFRVQLDENENYKNLGYITAQANRLVVFPNIYEHIVRPFELKDKSRSGFRKFVTLFLVDPATKIISTADIPPQQESWYPISDASASKYFPLLATDVSISTMSMDKAKEYRLDAALERRGKKVGRKCCTGGRSD